MATGLPYLSTFLNAVNEAPGLDKALYEITGDKALKPQKSPPLLIPTSNPPLLIPTSFVQTFQEPDPHSNNESPDDQYVDGDEAQQKCKLLCKNSVRKSCNKNCNHCDQLCKNDRHYSNFDSCFENCRSWYKCEGNPNLEKCLINQQSSNKQ